ncbi:IclR family transcriptional regulator [Nocardia sp. NPDC051030]|uniref:IclR family transcriptional regulator n=1 Tax=Nocardia sp. NPDC051030 TaxID=3155162 RepID=UPI003420C617
MTSMLSLGAESEDGRQAPTAMVERITLIMDLFERPHTVRTLEQVAQRTNLPRSSTYRILEQLTRQRWIDRTATGYRLGERSLGLGGREIGHSALRAAAAPVLLDLSLRTNLVVHLAVLDGAEVYYLDKVGGRSAVDVPSRVGGRAPAHCTALGKAILAWLPAERIDLEYADGIPRRTPRSIGDLGVLHRALNNIRTANGLAFERGEYASGIACAAMALRNPEGPVGAISVVGDANTPLDRVAPLVAKAARAISDELLGGPAAPNRPTLRIARQEQGRAGTGGANR